MLFWISIFYKPSYQRHNFSPCIRRHSCKNSHSPHLYKWLHFCMVFGYNHLYLELKKLEINFLLCWNTYILLVSRWQNIPTYTAVLSCVSGDTVTIVVIHSIGTSCTILARSQCTIIYILSKRFLSLKFCFILIIFWFNFNYCSCQGIITKAAILSRESSHTGEIVIIHAIHTSISILALSLSTVISIFYQRFLRLQICFMIELHTVCNFSADKIFLPTLQFFPVYPATQAQL